MSATAIHTLADLLGKVAHLSQTEVAELVTLSGPLPSPVDDAPILAHLTEIAVAATAHADLLAGAGGCRIEPLKTIAAAWGESPFAFAAVFMGVSRHDLGRRLGVDRAEARWLWSSRWRDLRTVDHVEVLAGLGRELAQFLEDHERERRRLHGRQAA